MNSVLHNQWGTVKDQCHACGNECTCNVYRCLYDVYHLWYSGPPTTNVTECMDPCKLTYCNACYYNEITLPTPAGCDNCCEDRLCLACVREWATCVKKRDERDNEVWTDMHKNYLFTFPCAWILW